MSKNVDQLYIRFRERGDAKALAKVFEKTAPLLLRIANHLVATPHEAEDLVQATFVTAIDRAASFDADRALTPWLIGILSHHAKDLRRSRFPELSDSVDVPETNEPLTHLLDKEEREQLSLSIRDLASPYGEVLHAHLMLGLPAQDIARRLDRSPGTVRAQIHRGLEKLKRRLPRSLMSTSRGLAAVAPLRGLEAVGREVLQHAKLSGAITTTTALTTSSTTLGGVLLTKKTITIGVVATALSIATWMHLPEQKEPPRVTTNEELAEHAQENLPVQRESLVPPISESTHSVSEEENVRLKGRLVDAQTLYPIVSGTVTLSWFGRQAPLEVETTPEGYYDVTLSSPPPLRIVAHAEGYAPSERVLQRLEDSLLLDERGIDLGDIVLYSSGTLSGLVVDEQERPLRAALYLLESESHPTFYPTQATFRGHSDSRGQFIIDDVGPTRVGHTRIFAVHDQGIGALEIKVPKSKQAMRDLKVVISQSLCVDVHVVDAEGTSIPGAQVEVFPIERPFVDGDWSRSSPTRPPSRQVRLGDDPRLLHLFRRQTDSAGIAQFRELPFIDASNAYAIRCRAEGFAGAYLDATQFEGRAHQRRDIVLRRPASGLIKGHVTDPQNDPREGVLITATGGDLANVTTALTDTAGAFTLLGLDPGALYTLSVDDETLCDETTRVVLPMDGRLEDLNVVVHPASSLRGRLVDQYGRAIEGLSPRLEIDGRRHRSQHRTGPDGEFFFTRVRSGRWFLQASAPEPVEAWEKPVFRKLVDVPSDFVEVVLHREAPGNARLSFSIRDRETGEFLTPKVLSVGRWFRDDPPTSFRHLNLDQAMATEARFKPGKYQLWLKGDEHPDYHMDFDVTEQDRDVLVEVAWPPGGRIHGQISWEEAFSALPEGVGVIASRPARPVARDGTPVQGSLGPFASVDAQGRFGFDRIAAGDITLSVVGPGVQGHVTVTVQSAEDVDVRVSIRPLDQGRR